MDEERALYHLQNAAVEGCTFAGPADGESALKESRDVAVKECVFSLRYPLWHATGFSMDNCRMDETCRAAIWYARAGAIRNSNLGGIKALRECEDIALTGCEIVSPEFGWRSRAISVENCDLTSEYAFFECRDMAIKEFRMKGKYSFQYVKNVTIENAVLDTKDAFWHSENVTVKNSVVKGEYLGWYSRGLTLIGCRIIGTQPLCYCEGLTLEDCTMEDTDLSFEYSDVRATVNGNIVSVKNPKSGRITADSIGEIILGDAVMETACVIEERNV